MLNWNKHLSAFIILTILLVTPSCYKGIAKKIKKDLELEVKRDYSVQYEEYCYDDGLGSELKNLDANKSLNIVLTHGIGTPDHNHFAKFKEMIAKGLGSKTGRPDTEPYNFEMNVCTDDYMINGAKVNRSRYTIQVDGVDKKVFIYDVDWSPVTKGAKEMVNRLDENPHRSALAKAAKAELFIDNFADLALYLGDYYKECIQDPFKIILNDLNKSSSVGQIVLVGGSFGNEIFMDVLNDLGEPEKGNIEAGSKLSRIYMLSNQLPFSALLTMPAETEKTIDSYVQYLYSDIIEYGKRVEKMPDIYSFYDPNDVFGYKLPEPKKYGIDSLHVNNIKVSNTIEWTFNPSELRKKYLSKVKDKKMQMAFRNMLYQNSNSQNVKVDLTGPSKSAKKNISIVGAIVRGDEFDDTEFNTSFDLVKKEKAKKVGWFRRSIKKQGEKKWVEKGKRKGPLKKIPEAIVGKWLNNQIKKVDVSNAFLPYELPSESFEETGNEIQGIAESVRDNDVTNIVTMHGMRSKTYDHFDVMVDGLATELGFLTKPREKRIWVDPACDNCIEGRTSIHLVEYKNEDEKILRFFVLYWSSLTMPGKNILKELEDEYIGGEDHSFVIELFKEAIINDGFTDVAMTTNQLQRGIHNLLDTTFQLLLNDNPFDAMGVNKRLVNQSPDEQNNYFIVSSLGSKLFMDYLITRMEGAQPNAVVSKVLRQTDKVFMLTNQLPMLGLKDIDGALTDQDDYIHSVYGNWETEIKVPLNIVAFNDPNDVLGFRLPVPESSDYLKVENVSLNIAEGLEVNQFYTYKLSKKVDKVINKMVDKKSLRKQRKKILQEAKFSGDEEYWGKACLEELDLKKKYYKEIMSSVVFKFLIDQKETDRVNRKPKQTFVIRMDTAHEAPSEDKRIFKIMSHGTAKMKKSVTPEMKSPGRK